MLRFVCESRLLIESNWNNLTFDLVPILYSQIEELPPEVLSEWNGNNHVQYCLDELYQNSESCGAAV